MLSNVYLSAELYMLQDKSENFEATWEFLDRRINDAYNIRDMVGMTSTLSRTVGRGIGSIFSILSPSNLQMDDTLMKQMQDQLRQQEAEKAANAKAEEKKEEQDSEKKSS